MRLKSRKYPNIEYEKGEEIFLFSEAEGHPRFIFDVEEALTSDDKVMEEIGLALDEVETLEEIAKDCLKQCLSKEDDEYFATVSYFMEFHRDELDEKTVESIFEGKRREELSFAQMVDYLKLNRFGNLIDGEWEKHVMVLDLTFDPEITDELLVVYFDLGRNVVCITHES
ncbi:DUF2004 domain-containing protein [Filifactor villosus]|uniref:DUF2004 domain-containing protein n=1 Tax=Filifactor villosus TaxID=29374 RepID=A0ABV9QLU4_9FIRM